MSFKNIAGKPIEENNETIKSELTHITINIFQQYSIFKLILLNLVLCQILHIFIMILVITLL